MVSPTTKFKFRSLIEIPGLAVRSFLIIREHWSGKSIVKEVLEQIGDAPNYLLRSTTSNGERAFMFTHVCTVDTESDVHNANLPCDKRDI